MGAQKLVVNGFLPGRCWNPPGVKVLFRTLTICGTVREATFYTTKYIVYIETVVATLPETGKAREGFFWGCPETFGWDCSSVWQYTREFELEFEFGHQITTKWFVREYWLDQSIPTRPPWLLFATVNKSGAVCLFYCCNLLLLIESRQGIGFFKQTTSRFPSPSWFWSSPGIYYSKCLRNCSTFNRCYSTVIHWILKKTNCFKGYRYRYYRQYIFKTGRMA